ncbi:hypothetical protein F5X98DRAFT_346153 [Xylaria grammica]|nr:hypothetical protein F5X98DRAFT_346153 [Xylaria grammica]
MKLSGPRVKNPVLARTCVRPSIGSGGLFLRKVAVACVFCMLPSPPSPERVLSTHTSSMYVVRSTQLCLHGYHHCVVVGSPITIASQYTVLRHPRLQSSRSPSQSEHSRSAWSHRVMFANRPSRRQSHGLGVLDAIDSTRPTKNRWL